MKGSWHDPDNPMNTHNSPVSERMGLTWLIVAAIATVLLWQIPFGDYILYPFTILATWFHEMGHGVTAVLLGGNFQKLLIFPNGSGVAFHNGPVALGPIGRALVAAGGPMGPPIAGAAFILAGRRFRSAQLSLIFLAVFLILSAALWVRSPFGLLAVSLLGLGILSISLFAPRWFQGFAIQFLGVQACVSSFHQLDYLFTRDAIIGGRLMLSDSAQIAQQLLLPYWVWGGLMAIASLVLLVQSLRLTYR